MRLSRIAPLLLALLAPLALAADGVLGGSTAITIESEGPGTGHATLTAPPWPLVDITIQLAGDSTCEILHAPAEGKGIATWRIGGLDGDGDLRALRARVVLLGLDIEAVPELFPNIAASWNLAAGWAFVEFLDFPTHDAIVLHDVPAWSRPVEVKADFEADYTAATLEPVNGSTSFDLTQRVHVVVTEAASASAPQP